MKRILPLLWVLLALVCFRPSGLAAQEHGSQHAASAEQHQSEKSAESPWAPVWRWGNFLILFGFLGWKLRKPFQEFLSVRAKAIEEGLANGRQAKESAQLKSQEIENRLAYLDREVQELKDQAKKEAEEERLRVLDNARLEAQKIMDLAGREIEGLRKSARLELKAYVAELAVKLAEERLRSSLGTEEEKKILERFLESLTLEKN